MEECEILFKDSVEVVFDVVRLIVNNFNLSEVEVK